MTPKGLARIVAFGALIALPLAARGQSIRDRLRQKAQDKVQQKTDSMQAARDARLDSLSQGVVDKATGAVECLVTNSGCIKRAFAKGKTVELRDSTGKVVTATDSANAVGAAGGVPASVANAAAAISPASDAAPPAAVPTAPAPASSAPAPAGKPMVPGSGPFEGVIMVHAISDDGTATDMPYQMKGNKMRIEMTGRGGQSGVVIMDPALQKTLILMPSQRMYMEMATDNTTQQGQASAQGNKASDVTFTGQHETIAGYPCDDARYTDSDGKPVELCLAKGLGGFSRPPMGNGVAGRGGRGARGGGGSGPNFGQDMFPLKVVKAVKLELQVTSITRQSLDASLFEVPAGWQKFGGRQ